MRRSRRPTHDRGASRGGTHPGRSGEQRDHGRARALRRTQEAIALLPNRWLEFGVVEHLFSEADPAAYQTLVDKYGHVAIHPDTNTASWMLGRALWALQREGELLVKPAGGTGRWSYLREAHAWSVPPTPTDPDVVSWAEFAMQRSFDPETWPAIDWRPTPNAVTSSSD